MQERKEEKSMACGVFEDYPVSRNNQDLGPSFSASR